jgi:molybdopterin converting factor subunit 1
MLIHVRLFAMIREKAGTSALTLELPEDARVADAAAALAERLPAVAAYLSRVAFAVNEAYAAREALLRPGDELAIIPPVSGGTGAGGGA